MQHELNARWDSVLAVAHPAVLVIAWATLAKHDDEVEREHRSGSPFFRSTGCGERDGALGPRRRAAQPHAALLRAREPEREIRDGAPGEGEGAGGDLGAGVAFVGRRAAQRWPEEIRTERVSSQLEDDRVLDDARPRASACVRAGSPWCFTEAGAVTASSVGNWQQLDASCAFDQDRSRMTHACSVNAHGVEAIESAASRVPVNG